MRAIILDHPGCLHLGELPKPEIGAGELLIQVKAATTCGTDVKAFVRGHPQIPMPGPFGHEYSGIVIEAGEGARFAVGTAVMGVHSAPCGECLWCKSGQENLCESIMSSKVLGSYAELLRIPKRIGDKHVFEKPEGLSFEEASLLEPLACAAQGILELRKHRALPAENALVIGPGAIGLMFVKALRAEGVSRVVLAGRNPDRLSVGERFGAETQRWPDVGKDGFDLAIECTGQVEVWERTLDFPRRGGTAMLFGGCPSGTRACFDTRRVHYDQICVLSPFHFGSDAVRLAMKWLTEDGFDLSPLITGKRRLDEAEEAFGELIAGQAIKYAFIP